MYNPSLGELVQDQTAVRLVQAAACDLMSRKTVCHRGARWPCMSRHDPLEGFLTANTPRVQKPNVPELADTSRRP